jgi:hypothetical protein
MAKGRSASVKDDEQYEGLHRKGMSKSDAAGIANTLGASKKGGKNAGGGISSSQSSKRHALAVAAASAECFSLNGVKPGRFGVRWARAVNAG